MWENPSFSRHILHDRLGNGLSDRGPTGHAFEDELDDARRRPARRRPGPAARQVRLAERSATLALYL